MKYVRKNIFPPLLCDIFTWTDNLFFISFIHMHVMYVCKSTNERTWSHDFWRILYVKLCLLADFVFEVILTGGFCIWSHDYWRILYMKSWLLADFDTILYSTYASENSDGIIFSLICLGKDWRDYFSQNRFENKYLSESELTSVEW